MGSQVETQIQNCLNWAQWTFSTYWKPCHRKSMILQCEGCSTWTSSRILEHRYPVWQSWKIYQPPCKPTHHMSPWLIDTITYTFSTLNNWHSSSSYGWSPSSTPHPPENMENQKAYPMCHSWLITAHISLGHLEHHWKTFNRQMDRTWQLLQFLSQWPSTPMQLLATLQVELTNINDIYISYKPIILPAINLLNTDPSFDGHSNYNNWVRRSLLHFLGDVLSWLTGTATKKMSITSRKESINSFRHSLHNRKHWFTLYLSLMSHYMRHKWTDIGSMS